MATPTHRSHVCPCGQPDVIHRLRDRHTGAVLCYGCNKTIGKFRIWLDERLLDDLEAMAFLYSD